MAELRIKSGILGIRGPVFRPPIRRRPIYGGLAYLAPPRLALGVNVAPSGKSPGAPRNAAGR